MEKEIPLEHIVVFGFSMLNFRRLHRLPCLKLTVRTWKYAAPQPREQNNLSTIDFQVRTVN